MTADLLQSWPAREGHFLLESGYHTDLWLTLDALLVSPREVAPLVDRLGSRLARHGVTAVCGPLLGGAFLAQAIATSLGVDFFFTERVVAPASPGLFTAQYGLRNELRRRIGGHQVAVVDDVISAGSSVRATVAAVSAAGAGVVVVGALFALGSVAVQHFAGLGVPVETLGRRELALWSAAECPLCRDGAPLEDPATPLRPSRPRQGDAV